MDQHNFDPQHQTISPCKTLVMPTTGIPGNNILSASFLEMHNRIDHLSDPTELVA